MKVKNRLAEIMKETKTTQRQLADALNISKTTINTYAQNKNRTYNNEIVEAICQYFGIRVEDFFYSEYEQ